MNTLQRNRRQVLRRLMKGFNLLYYLVKYVLPLAGVIFIIYIFLSEMEIVFKLFFVLETVLIMYFIRRILSMIDENLLRTN